MLSDPIAGAIWECCSTEPGAARDPQELDRLRPRWLPAQVPGTAAGARLAAGNRSMGDLAKEIDERDWWYRAVFPSDTADAWALELEGLATIADVWLNGTMLLHSENMFVAHRVHVGNLQEENEIVLRFGALRPLLEIRRPRPRWKTLSASHQNLRWLRTTLLGRQPGWAVTPAPVGPWRPVRLLSARGPRVVGGTLRTSCQDDAGVVVADLEIDGLEEPPGTARLHVGGATGELVLSRPTSDPEANESEGRLRAECRVLVAQVQRWWPHTHGAQPLTAASLELDGHRVDLGSVGFRTVEVDRRDGAFQVLVNGVPVFCRGGCWFPIDPVNFTVSDAELRTTLELVRDSNMNMVRIPGGTVYEDERFWNTCDELGIMVWQDCMLGYLDPPDDAEFVREVQGELEQVLGRLSRHPSLTVLCGGQEIEEQAAFFGLPRRSRSFPLIDRVIPGLAGRLVPGVPYVSSSPSGGPQPSQPDVGICHYFGIGSYLRELDDARSCGARFVSEGLAFAVPPASRTVEESCGGAALSGHDPSWKQAVHHDTGRSWDTEDFRDFYVAKLFGVDPLLVRYEDPERALDLGRATVAEIMSRVMGEWRRPGSSCAGGLVVALRDLLPGAGWGVIDALGRPKAPWFTLRRVLAPVAILLTDEGLNGLRLHVLNDLPSAFRGEVTMDLFVHGEFCVESARHEVTVEARGATSIDSNEMFEGFRDLSYAYRFGPPQFDTVVASLIDSDGAVVSEVVHLPAGMSRARELDLGLSASAQQADGDTWTLQISTRRMAQWVDVDVDGFRPEDSWFHLPPAASRSLTLHPDVSGVPPNGYVRALNAQRPVAIVTGD